jgi:L-ascorbate metabolism protein UlaG (beta-lactamase superfamily)
MQLQLIRNATMVLSYAGRRVLTDPYFAARHSHESFAGKSPNPLVALPIPPDQIMEGVGLVIVSHLHSDHFDETAQEALPKDLTVLCQPGDESFIHSVGFDDVRPIGGAVEWEGIRVARTSGHHGLGEVEADMDNVSGFVLSAEGEPTVYWAGDTVLCDEVMIAIERHKPDVIVTHSSGATWPISNGEQAKIVMDADQTVEVCRLAPESTVVAIHLDSLDHGTVGRADMRAIAAEAGISFEQLLIPEDGEMIEL